MHRLVELVLLLPPNSRTQTIAPSVSGYKWASTAVVEIENSPSAGDSNVLRADQRDGQLVPLLQLQFHRARTIQSRRADYTMLLRSRRGSLVTSRSARLASKIRPRNSRRNCATAFGRSRPSASTPNNLSEGDTMMILQLSNRNTTLVVIPGGE